MTDKEWQEKHEGCPGHPVYVEADDTRVVHTGICASRVLIVERRSQLGLDYGHSSIKETQYNTCTQANCPFEYWREVKDDS